ncbi:MAG: orotate phosphoribosyltransferase [Nitrososphaerota archaeon]
MISSKALSFGSFRLSSGRISDYYIDLRRIPSYPESFREVLDAYEQVIKGIGTDRFARIAGVPLTGLVYAAVVSLDLSKPLLFVRRERKDYGMARFVEGEFSKGDTVLLVDDVATTGSSLLSSAERLIDEGCVVKDAVVLIDRNEGATQKLKDHGIELHSFTTITELYSFFEHMR